MRHQQRLRQAPDGDANVEMRPYFWWLKPGRRHGPHLSEQQLLGIGNNEIAGRCDELVSSRGKPRAGSAFPINRKALRAASCKFTRGAGDQQVVTGIAEISEARRDPAFSLAM